MALARSYGLFRSWSTLAIVVLLADVLLQDRVAALPDSAREGVFVAALSLLLLTYGLPSSTGEHELTSTRAITAARVVALTRVVMASGSGLLLTSLTSVSLRQGIRTLIVLAAAAIATSLLAGKDFAWMGMMAYAFIVIVDPTVGMRSRDVLPSGDIGLASASFCAICLLAWLASAERFPSSLSRQSLRSLAYKETA